MARRNDMEIYLTENEGKPVVAEKFTRSSKNKYLTSVSKNVYIDKFGDLVKKIQQYIPQNYYNEVMNFNEEND